ncbi:hypothetical protein Sfr7A_24405 [Streptomyces xinghaiensis]|nr:hypothetical protein Sfr7A_24405 [Streptomyces xinghaiensis]
MAVQGGLGATRGGTAGHCGRRGDKGQGGHCGTGRQQPLHVLHFFSSFQGGNAFLARIYGGRDGNSVVLAEILRRMTKERDHSAKNP